MPQLLTRNVGVDLYWLQLGAGGHFVRFNGRVYERLHALLDHRRPLDLYHSALKVTVPEGCFVIENSWPIPEATDVSRGVTGEGPVGSHHLGRFRAFRYEVRRWYEGTIADAEAVESPRRLSDDEAQARRVLSLTAHVPWFVWGRDELGIGEMWNSSRESGALDRRIPFKKTPRYRCHVRGPAPPSVERAGVARSNCAVSTGESRNRAAVGPFPFSSTTSGGPNS
jgi:hypothetical protein